MSKPSHTVVALHRPPWREALVAAVLLGGSMVVWLLSLGGLSLGWDSLNHHFYLGLMAVEGERLERDVFAAGSMSCQYPYAYVPLYWLQSIGATGSQAALVLALPALAAVPAVWLLSWAIWPVRTCTASLARVAWVGVAFLSPLWWSLLDSTSNDLLSTLPMVWAYALIAWRAACDWNGERIDAVHSFSFSFSLAWSTLAGVLVAIALTIKISQSFAALGLLMLTLASARGVVIAARRVAAMVLGGALFGLLVWWPWARDVWRTCGSPIYPMLVDWLRPLAGALP